MSEVPSALIGVGQRRSELSLWRISTAKPMTPYYQIEHTQTQNSKDPACFPVQLHRVNPLPASRSTRLGRWHIPGLRCRQQRSVGRRRGQILAQQRRPASSPPSNGTATEDCFKHASTQNSPLYIRSCTSETSGEDDVSSIAFRYQTEPRGSFVKLPDKGHLEIN